MAQRKTGAVMAAAQTMTGAALGGDATPTRGKRRGKDEAVGLTAATGWIQRTLTALRPAPMPGAREWRSEAAGIGIFVAALGLLLALWTFEPADMQVLAGANGTVQNLIGPVGARLADLLLNLLGVGAFGLDALLFVLAARTVYGLDIAPRLHVVAGCVGGLLAGLSLVHLVASELLLRPFGKDAAGLFGSATAELQRAFVSSTGTALASLLVLTTSASALTGKPLFRLFARWFGDELRRATADAAAALRDRSGATWRGWRAARAERRAAAAAATDALAAEPVAAAEAGGQRPAGATDAVIDFDVKPATDSMRVRLPVVAPATALAPRAGDAAAPLAPPPATPAPVVALPDTRPSSRMPRVTLEGQAPARGELDAVAFPAGHALTPAVDLLPPARARLRALAEAAALQEAEEPLPPTALLGEDELPPPVPAMDRPRLALPAIGFALVTDASADASADADAGAAFDSGADAAAGALNDDDDIYVDVSATSIDMPALGDFVPETGVDALAPSLREVLHASRQGGPRIVETEAMRGNTPAKAPLAAQGALAIGDKKDWRLPPRTLVQPPPERSVLTPYDVLVDNARVLEQKLADFKIAGEVTDIRPGPVVTTYEYKPAAGVKISRIAALKDDLTMSLAALRVRVVAPIPGRDVVGIEVPNKSRQIVYFREIIESAVYAEAGSKLTIVLGKDIEGGAMVTDLAKAPHLLVAGATGTGKSVGINSFLASLLFRAAPDDVKLLLIDPKVLELSVYEGIPHLLLPVIDDPHQAELALKWACREMDRRYHVLAEVQVRNVAGYKQKLPELREKARRSRVAVQKGHTVWVDQSEPGADRLPPAPEPEDLPYIVIVIDEFADLIMASGKEVEKAVARLAQKARAAGIHVILATQRPSTDVITGMIKANFPTRISFQVASSIDSKVVLNSVGAESLLGMGDMLFVPPGSSHIRRCHGTWITDDEVVRLADHWRAQGSPDYDMSILADPDAETPEVPDDDDLDPLYTEAVRVAVEADQASVSFLQRKLNIGYQRAARIIDHMEAKGVVGPSRGQNRPREIISMADGF